MQIIMFTGNECLPCKVVEEAFLKKHNAEIETGEADIINLDDDDSAQAQKFWMKNNLPFAPCIIVVTEGEKLITILDVEKYLGIEAKPPSFEDTKAVPVGAAEPTDKLALAESSEK